MTRPAHIAEPIGGPSWLPAYTRNIEREIMRLLAYLDPVSSTGNTSTTALAGGATFTGTGEKTNHPDVMVSVKTDAAGTLYFDFSDDGTNWDETQPPSGLTIASGQHYNHIATKGPRYCRVRLVNGGSAQTYLRLYTYFGLFA